MTSWEDIKRQAANEARDALSAVPDIGALHESLRRWWHSIDYHGARSGADLANLAATRELARLLNDAGLKDAADFVLSDWSPAGPHRPGAWIVAQLLGTSLAAHMFATSATALPRSPRFFGWDEIGAWEAFDAALSDQLLDASKLSIAIKWLDESVARANEEPGKFTYADTLSQDALRQQAPPDEPEWEHRFDVMVTGLWLITPLLRIDPKRTLGKLAELPHPAFVCSALTEKLAEAPAPYLATLIAAAPLAFDRAGNYLHSGAVVVEILNRAGAVVRQSAVDAEGRLPTASMDESDQLLKAAEALQAAVDPIIEALFSRNDAIPLAWSWIERLIFEGSKRGFWTNTRLRAPFDPFTPHLVLHPLGIMLVSLCRRLQLRPDWRAWIDKKDRLWRIDRLSAVVMVATETLQPPELGAFLRQALADEDIEVAGAESLVSRCGSSIETVGACAMARLPERATWFTQVWQHLRAKRERSWEMEADKAARDYAAELLVIWGLGATTYTAAEERQVIWMAVEQAMRDARQTDSKARPGVFWVAAAQRLFAHCRRGNAATIAITPDELTDLLFPYVAADATFMHIVLALADGGWEPCELARIVANASGDMARLIDQYIEFDGNRRKEHALIDRLKKLGAESASPLANQGPNGEVP